jgi:hypothetical protein
MVAAMAGRTYGFLQRVPKLQEKQRKSAWLGRPALLFLSTAPPRHTHWGTAGQRHRPNPAKRRQRSHGAVIASKSRPRAVFRRGEGGLGLLPTSLVRLRNAVEWLRCCILLELAVAVACPRKVVAMSRPDGVAPKA